LKNGLQRASTTTRNWSDGSRPNMPEMVLFIASTVSGGTSFWMTLRSKGSISWIKFHRIDFYKENKHMVIKMQQFRVTKRVFQLSKFC
jgi:hypothetical protein